MNPRYHVFPVFVFKDTPAPYLQFPVLPVLIFIMLSCPLSFQCLCIQNQFNRPWRHIHIPVIIFHKNKRGIIRWHLCRKCSVTIRKIQKPAQSLKSSHIRSLSTQKKCRSKICPAESTDRKIRPDMPPSLSHYGLPDHPVSFRHTG